MIQVTFHLTTATHAGRRLKDRFMSYATNPLAYPRRRDIRLGTADPVPPTGMLAVPLVKAPSGIPLPMRRDLRTGPRLRQARTITAAFAVAACVGALWLLLAR
ncbi:hypothetical protein [Arthrobacter crystallopoietes]|uniref:Uncharacterized protein n=1 Tax=Crystallibacter crystallopoietes TaxID=37928 RepID=A0A1H0ZEG3_9MICC|nr:hypothetical protein [Arthrobacter crystallopoietes]AUI52022.1 hypothetical protein AC20117_15740 [Arthrobacter crystallopoietes]SDQ25828.1 hypothetical protein SAMN04489742_0306 [Arthrobacter crystallopoietes]